MTTTHEPATKSWSAEELGERVFEACNAAFDVFTMHLGRKLGLYEAMLGKTVNSTELAQATATSERYVREWLEQQAVSGLLEVDNAAAAPMDRLYTLPDGYAEVLTDRDSLWYFGPAASMTAAAGTQLPALADAFRSGGGVSWDQFGDDMRFGQGEMNRPLFLQVLAQEWLASDPEISDILSRPGSKVADIGTGVGWSAIGIANTFPAAEITGFDVDQPSVDAATMNAIEHGVAERVAFTTDNPAKAATEDAFDLAIACECLHDMPDPVAVLAGIRRMVKSDGAVLILDERTHDEFTPDAGDMERFLYGFSVTTCLPDGMSHQPSVGTGTVMRRGTLEEYARRAGFDGVAEVEIDHEQFRLYRLI